MLKTVFSSIVACWLCLYGPASSLEARRVIAPVEVRVALDQSMVFEAEPVFMRVEFANLSCAPQRSPWFDPLLPCTESVQAVVSSEDRRQTLSAFGYRDRPASGYPDSFTIAPGCTIRFSVPLFFDPLGRSFVLGEPGTYRVCLLVRFDPNAARVLSNEVSVNVVRCEGPDKDDLRLLTDLGAPHALLIDDPATILRNERMANYIADIDNRIGSTRKESPYRGWLLWISAKRRLMAIQEFARSMGQKEWKLSGPDKRDDVRRLVVDFTELLSQRSTFLRVNSRISLAILLDLVGDSTGEVKHLFANSWREMNFYGRQEEDRLRFWVEMLASHVGESQRGLDIDKKSD